MLVKFSTSSSQLFSNNFLAELTFPVWAILKLICLVNCKRIVLKINKLKVTELHGYILGVLMHTNAWDGLWKGDETLKWVSVNIAWLHFTQYCKICSLCLPLTPWVYESRWNWATYITILGEVKPSSAYWNSLQCFITFTESVPSSCLS